MEVKSQKLLRAKICLNLNGGGGEYSTEVKTQSEKSWPNVHIGLTGDQIPE